MDVFDQTLTPAQLADYQQQALAEQVAWCRQRSAFYRQRLPREFSALRQLPFTTPQDLIQQGPQLVCLAGSQVQRIVTLRSSGSQAPKRLYFSPADLERTVDFFAVGMGWLVQPGQRAMICMPGSTPDGIGDLLSRGLQRLGVETLLYGPIRDYADCARQALAWQPHTLVGLPFQLRRLALTCPRLRPATVLLSADHLPGALATLIGRLWQCPVFDHYGLTESGYGCAVECPSHGGLHIRYDELLVEILEPETGAALPPGQWGEIVLTTLRRQAMPLLRYRTGDIGRLLPGPCACGCLLPRLDHVAGRLTELAQRPNLYQLDAALAGDPRLLDYNLAWNGELLTLSLLPADQPLTLADLPPLPWPVQIAPWQDWFSDGRLKRRLARS